MTTAKLVSLAQALSIDIPSGIEIEEGQGGQFVPPIDAKYKVRKSLASLMYGFFVSGETTMTLTGLQGSGKSSFPRYWHACLNYPLLEVTCNARTEMSDLIGMYKPDEKGGLSFHKGPMLVAAEQGISLMLDEYNTVDPGVSAGMHPWLEGTGAYIPELKQFVRPRKGFRCFLTSNPADAGQGFMGRIEQDAALEDRSWTVWVDYPDKEDEVAIISRIFQESGESQATGDDVATKMVEMATKLRKQFSEGKVKMAMSTRALCRWAVCATIFSNAGGETTPLSFGLEIAFTNKLPPEEKAAVNEIAYQMFGGAKK